LEKRSFLLVLFFITLAAGISAEEAEAEAAPASPGLTVKESEAENRPVVVFSEGAAVSWLTRIISQTARSNFLFEDFLPGLYFRTEVANVKYFTPMIRLAAYYPLVSTFNQYPQKAKTPLHFGTDVNAGIEFGLLDFDYFRLNFGPALHLFFMSSDRWNYFDLGAAAFLEMELPLSERWTVIFNGFASLDNGNLGGNRLMEPFDVAYQYQVDIGVRYSKKFPNRVSLFSRGTRSEEELRAIVR